jgi:flagellar protein FlbD
MISVTKLSNAPVVINAELIKFIESTPDTLITLTTGDRVLVKESIDEIIRRTIDYGRSLRKFLPPT